MIQRKQYKDLYKDNLLNDVIPFWVKNSLDKEYGGYFTCLDRKGNVFDTDKFIWLQARQVWMFSVLYNQVEQKQEWLDIAVTGAEFLKKHGRDENGNWYFSLTREGKPLVQPYNIFSDCFATMAFAQLSNAAGNDEYADIALQTYHIILKRKDNPKGKYNKVYPGTRPGKGFALPMILSNLVLEIEHLLKPEEVEETISFSKKEIFGSFYQPDKGAIVETVNPDGSFQDSFVGRLTIPGHGLEAMWFMMDIAERTGDKELIKKTVDISLHLLAYFSNSALLGFSQKNPDAFEGAGVFHKVLVSEVWRGMFAAEMIPASIFILLLLIIPETPRWLIKRSTGRKK